jgi:hypothetical protein
MDQVEGVLIVVVLAVVTALVRVRLTAPSPDGLEDMLDSAHDKIDEIELARVRSMLQRR